MGNAPSSPENTAVALETPLKKKRVIKPKISGTSIPFIYHDSFEEDFVYNPPEFEASPEKHMPDDITREMARNMHFAGYKWNRHHTSMMQALKWKEKYFQCRDQIVTGNIKLTYTAVRRRIFNKQVIDDFRGDSHIALIKATEAYNPWLGIRFSTYAYTCLVRELIRLRGKYDHSGLHSTEDTSLDDVQDAKTDPVNISSFEAELPRFLSDADPLLSSREKILIRMRFLDGDGMTLEQVGQAMGLSKERIRQVQKDAFRKIRERLGSLTT